MSVASKTYSQKPSEVTRDWYVIDASSHVLGRVAERVAGLLNGKQKATYTPHVDGGDYVVVINADKIKVSNERKLSKPFYRHSGYPGATKEQSLEEALKKRPEFVLQHAVKGMLPKNKLTDAKLARMKVFTGSEHKHEAQQPKKVEV